MSGFWGLNCMLGVIASNTFLDSHIVLCGLWVPSDIIMS